MSKEFEKLKEFEDKLSLVFGDLENKSLDFSKEKFSKDEIKEMRYGFQSNKPKDFRKLKETLESKTCKKCNKMSISQTDDVYLIKHEKCYLCFIKEEKITI